MQSDVTDSDTEKGNPETRTIVNEREQKDIRESDDHAECCPELHWILTSRLQAVFGKFC
jgi:hypothetical protein